MSRFRYTKGKQKATLIRSGKYGNSVISPGAIDNGRTGARSRTGYLPGGNRRVLEYNIPFKGFLMSRDWNFHLDAMESRLVGAGWPYADVRENLDLISGIAPDIVDWAIHQAQTGVHFSSDRNGFRQYTANDYLEATGNQMRWCGGCSGSIGSCPTVCTNVDVGTNIGGNNWKYPGSWKVTSVKLTFYITF